MMQLTRRHLIRSAANIAIAAPALRLLAGCGGGGSAPSGSTGPITPAGRPTVMQRVSGLQLVTDPAGLLDLAPGLSYAAISRAGDVMTDGFPEPAAHDGMSAFPVAGDPDRCLLVRNHELSPGGEASGAFGANGAGASRISSTLIYDRNASGNPNPGATSTVLVNMRTVRAERTHLSLAGTAVNCSGGPTPWGAWLSCEETEATPGPSAQKSHGFVFEVAANATTPVTPTPLTAMGRFRHEACAVDPATGIVYLSEDQGDGLFYRFLPNTLGQLAQGGRLQALVLMDQAGADTRNWSLAMGGDPNLRLVANHRYPVRWVDLSAVDAPNSDLRQRGRQAGAAIFARGEGVAFALDSFGVSIFLSCTSGGAANLGQVWRYLPSPFEGGSREAESPPELELFVESTRQQEFDMCDNIVASPLGDLVLCEDGPGDNFVRAVTNDGVIYPIARNADAGKSEFCGACFSPDGRILFVNIQRPGITLAITGDWSALRQQARATA